MLPQSDKSVSNPMREAIAQVLGTYLAQHQVPAMLEIWDKTIDGKTKRSLINDLMAYAKEVSQSVNLSEQSKNNLRVALYQTIGRSNGSTDKPASAQSQQSSTSVVKPTPEQSEEVSYRPLNKRSPRSPAFTVFVEVGERMIEGAQRTGYKEFREFLTALQDYSQTLSMTALARQNLLDWCSHKDSLQRGIIEDEKLPGIIHLFYRALCDGVGPVVADTILANAISHAQALPEATLFPPKRLL